MSPSVTWVVYQPLVVGLGAVILATAGNTVLEWYRQTLQDRRQAATIRRAFAEELRTHRKMYDSALSAEQRTETTGSLLVPVDTFLPIYDNMIGKIGLLAPAEVGAILKAYSNIILSPKNLIIIGRIERDEFASFVAVPVKYAAIIESMHRKLVEVIDEALALLDA